jgi:tRNA A37 threonylcarbamoyladenosine modification protein TsaB
VDGSAVNVIAPVELMPVEDLIVQLGQKTASQIIVCGEALDRYGPAVREAKLGHVSLGRVEAPRAGVVAEIAAARIVDGKADDPLALVPLYVSPPPIGPPAGRK